MFEKFWKDAATILRSFWYWQIEATESQQGLRYQLAAGDAALAPDLSFLSVETVRVSIDAWTYTRWDGCTSWDDSIYLAMLHQMCWLSGDIWWSFCLLISLLSSWALRSWAPVSAACLKCRKASKRHRLLGRKSQGMLELFRVLSSVWKVYKPYQTISGGWIWQPPKTSKMHIECGRSEVSSNTPRSLRPALVLLQSGMHCCPVRAIEAQCEQLVPKLPDSDLSSASLDLFLVTLWLQTAISTDSGRPSHLEHM